ncbi:MAG: hypothetical protein HN816_12755 [Gammaproteobacteria bacterium]|nr:hypothetical protein [Gammaproteobacteria bacterium]
MNNRDITFSPDGTIMLTSIVAPKNLSAIIAISYRRDGKWTALEVAPFSGQHADIEPSFSPDGKAIFFASKRPKPNREGADWDIWQVDYHDGNWGEPVNPGSPVNTAENEFYPSTTLNGTLYFTSSRSDSLGNEDLYLARLTNGAYTEVLNIGAPVNSKAWEFNSFIAPDESYLIFGSQGREGEIGGGDLYISYRKEGSFEPPQLLGRQINTTRLDYCPSVHGGRLYFTSELPARLDISSMTKLKSWYESAGNGLGDIYWVDFHDILSE